MLAMNSQSYVQTDVKTQPDTTDACRENELYSAICFQGIERTKEYVGGLSLHVNISSYKTDACIMIIIKK